jgi:hypothetical protein
MPDFPALLTTLVDRVHTLQTAYAQTGQPPSVHQYHLETRQGHLTVNGRRWPMATAALSGHDHLLLHRAGMDVANALDAVESALHAIPGLEEDWRLLHLRTSFNPTSPTGWLRLESAGVCPSGDFTLSALSLADQGALLARQLQRAWRHSRRWTRLTPWYVQDLPDTRGPGGLIREVMAPDPEGALAADGWTWWAIAPQPHHRRQVSASLEGHPVLVSDCA